MHTRRFNCNTRSLFGAVLVFGVALALAGPANAQTDNTTDDSKVQPQARTGKLHDDCNNFSTQESSDGFEMQADCRISDDNDNRTLSSVDLADDIGVDGNARLIWGNKNFHELCEAIDVSLDYGGRVRLKAKCYTGCLEDSQGNRTCMGSGTTSQMDLSSRYRVTKFGAIEVD